MCHLNIYTIKTSVEKNMMFQNKNIVIRSFKVTWEKDCKPHEHGRRDQPVKKAQVMGMGNIL